MLGRRRAETRRKQHRQYRIKVTESRKGKQIKSYVLIYVQELVRNKSKLLAELFIINKSLCHWGTNGPHEKVRPQGSHSTN